MFTLGKTEKLLTKKTVYLYPRAILHTRGQSGEKKKIKKGEEKYIPYSIISLFFFCRGHMGFARKKKRENRKW